MVTASPAAKASMDSQELDDWSPASVFGATVVKAVSSPRPPVREKNPDEGGPSRRVSPGGNNEKARRKPRHRESVVKLVPSPEEEVEGNDDARADDAARILQKHWRVALLYHLELDTLDQVEQLRQQLEVVSAQAIAEWFRRSRLRSAIDQYVMQHRQREETEHKAGECLVRWLYWQGCIALARRTLQRRVAARRCLVCWWRRILLARRFHMVKVEQLARMRANASCVIVRWIWRTVSRQRAKRSAAMQIQACVIHTLLRRRAVRELQRRRRDRKALDAMGCVVSRWAIRRAALARKEYVNQQRKAEEMRMHNAACVLQRLMRVVLTAFRLIRRRHAVITIQSSVRARQAQRQYATLCKAQQRRAAIHIQRMTRGHAARKRFARLLQQLRERFKCQNCGLIEPGGLYCKFCGRRRTTFDVLGERAASMSCTTESTLRKKRRKASKCEDTMSSPPPAPPHHGRKRTNEALHRLANGLTIAPSVVLMMMPELAPPSPSRQLPAVVVSPRGSHSEMSLSSPVQPRKPPYIRTVSGRPSIKHRSLLLDQSPTVVPTNGTSVDKTRQRAEALMQHEVTRHSHSTAMDLHLKRLQKGGKAASR